jgi:hypothetical protein
MKQHDIRQTKGFDELPVVPSKDDERTNLQEGRMIQRVEVKDKGRVSVQALWQPSWRACSAQTSQKMCVSHVSEFGFSENQKEETRKEEFTCKATSEDEHHLWITTRTKPQDKQA